MKILLIQILRLGDAIQLLPVIQGIRHFFPEAALTVLTSRLGSEVLALSEDVDEVVIIDKELISDRMTAGGSMRIREAFEQLKTSLSPVLEQEWDWVINFGYSFYSGLLSYLMKTRHRSGFAINRHRQYVSKEKWYALSIASFMNRRYSNFNWIDINRNILGLDPLPPPPYLPPSPGGIRAIENLLLEKDFSGHRIVGICPGASAAYKRWAAEHFAQVAGHLIRERDCRILLFGSAEERALSDRIAQKIGFGALNLAGETNLCELRDCVLRCDVLLTNDTGPMHLAAAMGTPVVGLFFSTHFVETGPYGEGHIAVHPDLDCFPCQNTAGCHHKNCLSKIPPDAVSAAVEHVLSGGRYPLKPIPAEKVRLYASCYDRLGNLDWRPIDGRPIDEATLQRRLLKDAWLDSCGLSRPDDLPSENGGFSESLEGFGLPEDSEALKKRLGHSGKQWADLLCLLQEALRTILDLQTRMLENPSEEKPIAHLGKRLEAIEREIASIDSLSSMAFVTELLTVMRENIEPADPLTLCLKTAEVYRNISGMVEAMIARTEKTASGIRGEDCGIECFTSV